MFPTSWQVVFLNEAIARQLIPVISFFAVAWASKAYFRQRLLSGDVFAGEAVLLISSFVFAPLIMLQQGVQYQDDDTASSVLAAYGSFCNNIIIGLFFLTGRLFCARGWSKIAAGAAILLVAVTTHFAQFRLMAAVALAILLGAPPRLAAVTAIVGLSLGYAVQMNDIPERIAANPNQGIRLAFVSDVFSSLSDTHGMGIGYGTESVRWTYRLPGLPEFTFMPDLASISRERLLEVLSRGVHNSFAQATLRTGILGACLLLVAFFAAFPPRNLTRSVKSHASIVFVVIFVACFVNPGLESPVQLVGIGFIYGYLLALRGTTRPWRRAGSWMYRMPWFPLPTSVAARS
ncbi:MAG TPA: hypothetical protein VJS37_08330 [Terriglobales bacterium]|nr:hypothetical protein [Terriglobales bacterium]